jgi:adenylate cyclase
MRTIRIAHPSHRRLREPIARLNRTSLDFRGALPSKAVVMSEGRVHRRLSAVLAADVVGYSRLMEQDEAGTLAVLKDRHRDVVRPLVAQHEGRIFKVVGDGVLAEFASAVNAVQCAVAMQHAMAEANGELPDDRRIVLRIGINLGDIVIESSDRYGEGVNIAARLEGIADPGGILISGTIYDQVRNKVKVSFEDLGSQSLKNIVEPVRVYRVAGTPRVLVAAARTASDRPSIAVLPFTNMSDTPEQQYFSDGIGEDIVTELSRFRELLVIAGKPTAPHGEALGARSAGRELGAKYVVQGGVRKLGSGVRITVQLIDTTSGSHLWAERFDCNEQEIFAVQDQIVATIVGTLVGRLHAVGAERASRKPPASLAAYECVLRGKALPLGDREKEAERRRLFERAIALDPEYGQAHALLAHSLFLEWYHDMSAPDSGLDPAFQLARRAVALDERESTCHFAIGWIYLFRKSYALAEEHYRRALELTPNNAEQAARMGSLFVYLGEPDRALAWLKQAKLLNPYFDVDTYWDALGGAHFCAHRYEDAIAAFSRPSTPSFWAQALLAASYALGGRTERTQAFAAEVLRLAPDFSLNRLAEREPYKNDEDRAHLVSGLRKAGLPETSLPHRPDSGHDPGH